VNANAAPTLRRTHLHQQGTNARVAKPRGVCIFCGFEGRLSKEHVLPKWMRPHLPGSEGTVRISRLTQRDFSGRQVVVGEEEVGRPLAGEHRSRTLRVVCGTSNNGWMCRIVADVRPLLEPLMLGDWQALTPAMQAKLARWVTLHNIVFEQAFEHGRVTDGPERQRFMKELVPGPNRYAWIARCMGGETMPTFYRLLGRSTHPSQPGPRTQLIAFSVGRVCMLTLNDPHRVIAPGRIEEIQELLRLAGFCQICPTGASSLAKPSGEFVAESLVEFFNQAQAIAEARGSSLAMGLRQLEGLTSDDVFRMWTKTRGQ
jgi:hypothetical protein